MQPLHHLFCLPLFSLFPSLRFPIPPPHYLSLSASSSSLPSPISNPLSLLLRGIGGSPVHSGMPNECYVFYKPLPPISALPPSLPPATPLPAFQPFTSSLLLYLQARSIQLVTRSKSCPGDTRGEMISLFYEKIRNHSVRVGVRGASVTVHIWGL